jgi:hypothetical protein
MKSAYFTGVAILMLMCGSAMASVVTDVTHLFSPAVSPIAGNWYLSDVRTGGSATLVDLTGLGGNLESGQPIPTGAAKLTTDFTNEAKAEVSTYDAFGLASSVLGDMSLGYCYFKQSVSGGNIYAAPSLKLTIQTVGGAGDNYGTLTYEPYWNQADGTMNVPTNAWQSVNINSSTGAGDDGYGGWWWNGGFEITSGSGGPPLRSLTEWVAAFQASDPTDFAGAQLVAVGVGVGTYNQGQIGYFDSVYIQSAAGSGNALYNFEVPEPGTMAMLAAGGLTALAATWLRRRMAK